MRQHNSQIKKKTRQTIADKNRWCSERVSSSCFTSDTRRATVVKIPMISHKKRRKEPNCDYDKWNSEGCNSLIIKFSSLSVIPKNVYVTAVVSIWNARLRQMIAVQ